MTFKAKGLFWYLQSKPDEWDFSADRIKNDTKESRDAILTGLQELEQFWFLKRYKFKNEKGQWDVEYILFDEPETATENPTWTESENPTLENPKLENPTHNKKGIIKKEINKKESDICPYFLEFWEIYKRKIDKQKAEKKFERLSTQEKMLAVAGAKKWAEKWEIEQTDLEFIPHPTTWLNNRRWEAQITIKTKTKKVANAYQEEPTDFLAWFTK